MDLNGRLPAPGSNPTGPIPPGFCPNGFERTHLGLTLWAGVAELTGDHATPVSSYEQVHFEILSMADMLNSGIVARVPNKSTGLR